MAAKQRQQAKQTGGRLLQNMQAPAAVHQVPCRNSCHQWRQRTVDRSATGLLLPPQKHRERGQLRLRSGFELELENEQDGALSDGLHAAVQSSGLGGAHKYASGHLLMALSKQQLT